jgi:hypothetical protein
MVDKWFIIVVSIIKVKGNNFNVIVVVIPVQWGKYTCCFVNS